MLAPANSKFAPLRRSITAATTRPPNQVRLHEHAGSARHLITRSGEKRDLFPCDLLHTAHVKLTPGPDKLNRWLYEQSVLWLQKESSTMDLFHYLMPGGIKFTYPTRIHTPFGRDQVRITIFRSGTGNCGETLKARLAQRPVQRVLQLSAMGKARIGCSELLFISDNS